MVLKNLQRRSPTPGQKGFLVIGCLLALAAVAIIAVISVDRIQQERRARDADFLAAALADAARNVETFVGAYHSQLSSDAKEIKRLDGVTVPIQSGGQLDYADILKLIDMNAGTSNAPIIPGAKFVLKLSIPYFSNPSCVNAQSGKSKICDIRGVVYIDRPYTRAGRPDFGTLGRAATALGIHGGYSTASDPSNFLFLSDKVPASEDMVAREPNPTNKAGLLARRFGNWDKSNAPNGSAYAGAFGAAVMGATPFAAGAYDPSTNIFQEGDYVDSQGGQEDRRRRLRGRDPGDLVYIQGGMQNSLLGNISMQNHSFNSRESARNPVTQIGDLHVNRLSVPTVESLRGLSAMHNLTAPLTVTNQFLGVLSIKPPSEGGAEPQEVPHMGDRRCGRSPGFAVGLLQTRREAQGGAPAAYGLLQCVDDVWTKWSNEWRTRQDFRAFRLNEIPDDQILGQWRFCRDVTEPQDAGIRVEPDAPGVYGDVTWKVLIFDTGPDISQKFRVECFN